MNQDKFQTFTEGFADATGCTLSEAHDAWKRLCWHKRLTAEQVGFIEAGGYACGWEQGCRFCEDAS